MSFWGFVTSGTPLAIWLIAFFVSGIALGVYSGYFRARRIQPNGFKWSVFRHEVLFGAINITFSAFALGGLTAWLTSNEYITFNSEPTAWWVIALEYTLSFFLFDTYFYWFHRAMHIQPIYKWVHLTHHRSTSPNLLTTVSVNPLESFINGGFTPLFLTIFTVHDATFALIAPTNIIMGLYVHAGYEFLPRWWNKSWATKWFITTTFHDQHHKYFNWNFGGYTTIWDYLCGTVRPKYEADFEQPKARQSKPVAPAVAAESASNG